MDFPILTIGDFVDTQKGPMDQLGVETWHAVMGALMGGLQSYEWAASYPDRQTRVIPVISSGSADADLIAWLDVRASPFRLDPNWNGGDYHDGDAARGRLDPGPVDRHPACLVRRTVEPSFWSRLGAGRP